MEQKALAVANYIQQTISIADPAYTITDAYKDIGQQKT